MFLFFFMSVRYDENFVSNCAFWQVLELRQVIGCLLFSLIEENGPEPLAVAKVKKEKRL